LTVKGLLRLDAGDEEAAVPLLEAAIKENQPNLRALRELGRLHHQAGRFEEALALFERGRKLESIEPAWLEEIARSAKQAGDVDRSIRATIELLAADPDDLDQRR